MRQGDIHFLVSAAEGDAALRGAGDEALLDEVRLVDFFEGSRFFADGNRERVEAHGASVEAMEDAIEDTFVHFIESIGINFEQLEGSGSDGCVNHVCGADLSEVAAPAEEVVGDAGRATGTASDFKGTLGCALDVEDACTAQENFA